MINISKQEEVIYLRITIFGPESPLMDFSGNYKLWPEPPCPDLQCSTQSAVDHQLVQEPKLFSVTFQSKEPSYSMRARNLVSYFKKVEQ